MHAFQRLTSFAFVLLGGAVALTLPAHAADDLLKTVKDRGVLRVCDVDYVPWNLKNPITNRWEGVDVDVANEVASQLKVKVEHVDATWGTVVPSLQTGKCDIAMDGFFMTPARAELVTFTQPFTDDGVSLFVPDKSTAKTVADLDQPGKVIVAKSGSLEEAVARQTFKKATVKSLTNEGNGAAVLEVAAGRADAAAAGYYGNIMFLKSNPNLKVRLMSDTMLSRSPMAYALPAREYFFRDYFNTVLTSLAANGKMKALIDKWTH